MDLSPFTSQVADLLCQRPTEFGTEALPVLRSLVYAGGRSAFRKVSDEQRLGRRNAVNWATVVI